MNGYDLSRAWFNFRASKKEKVRSIHTELYLYIVDLWNRVGQPKNDFGLPTDVTMNCLCIGSYNTYKAAYEDLVKWGIIKEVVPAKNQYQSRVIALSKFDKATDKALDKATAIARAKATDKATDTIYKPINKETNKPINKGFELSEVEVNPFDEKPKDPSRVLQANEVVAKLFGISELNQPKAYMKIGNFVRYLHGQNQIDYLKEQFKYYRKLKQDIEQGKYLHSWENYIGTAEESYEDGAWNKFDWKHEYEKKAAKPEQQDSPTVLSGPSYSQRMKRVNEMLRQEALWLAGGNKTAEA